MNRLFSCLPQLTAMFTTFAITILLIILLSACNHNSSQANTEPQTGLISDITISKLTATEQEGTDPEDIEPEPANTDYHVGDTLVVDYTTTNIQIEVRYIWLRDNIAIDGATSSTYTLVVSDSGHDISVELIPISADTDAQVLGTPQASTSIEISNSPPSIVSIAITDINAGSAMVGDMLTASYTYNDLDGDPEAETQVSWLSGGAIVQQGVMANAVFNASSLADLSYQLVQSDSGQIITVEITPTAQSGILVGESHTVGNIIVSNSGATASSVSITDTNGGDGVVGDLLLGGYIYVDADGDPEGASLYRWLRNGASILGATNSSYTLTISDTGQSISFEVTPVPTSGSVGLPTVSSNSLTVVSGSNNVPPLATDVNITDSNGGDALIGDLLLGGYVYSDADGDAEGISTFRWLRGGAAIAAATTATYTVVTADSNQSITFEVTPIAFNGVNPGTAVISDAIVVSNSAPIATGVSITDSNGGTPLVGDLLLGGYVYFDADGDAEGTSTFRWLRGGAAITDAILPSYVLVAADTGQTISFEITPVAPNGVSLGLAVISTAITIQNSAPTATSVAITDTNGGYTDVGDTLDASYVYLDMDTDSEGSSTFRWLRNSAPITGETSISYTLVNDDDGQSISFEVTPVATSGMNPGSPVTSAALIIARPPKVAGLARYLDINHNGVNDVGDEVIIPFDQTVSVTGAAGSDFSLPVIGDTLGAGASIAQGPGVNEVTITLGTSAKFKSRQLFTGANAVGSPSAIDISAAIAPDVIEGISGIDALFSSAIDLQPMFVDSGQTLGLELSNSGTFGDVDSDGDLDWLVTNASGASNLLYLNDSNGNFTNSGQTLSTDGQDIALADFDSDGHLDAVIVKGGSSANLIFLNDGNGIFTDSSQTLGANDSVGVDVGDIDNDGDIDIVVANANGLASKIWLNDNSGNFTVSGQALNNTASSAVKLADIDSDGDLDILLLSLGLPNRVFTNDGSGSFTDSGQLLGNNNSVNLAMADIDNDGDIDMLVANSGSDANILYLNDSNGIFTDSGELFGSGSATDVSLIDIDSDGDIDALFSNDSGSANDIFLNDSTGSFTDSELPLASSGSQGLTIGDIDGDGDNDIAFANALANTVLFNSLSGTWGSSTFVDSGQSLANDDTFSVTLADLDGDGDLDLVVGNDNNDPNKVWFNDGYGVFTDSGQSLGSGETKVLILGDVNGDGNIDIVEGNKNSANLVWLNDGTGSFTDSGQTLGVSNDTYGLTLGDVDSDGDLDLLEANDSGETSLLYFNDSDGIFIDSTQNFGVDWSYSMVLGDIDNDGDLDIVQPNGSNDPDRVYTNNGLGIFTLEAQALGADQGDYAALGDIDNDGDLDYVVSNYSEPDKVYTNDGNGIFTDTGQALGAELGYWIGLVDIDGDGDLDMQVANSYLPNNLYLNDGSGTFTDSGQVIAPAPIRSRSVAFGDLDQDGDLDMVIGNFASPTLVYMNQ